MLLRPLVEAAAIVGVNLHAPIVSADAGDPYQATISEFALLNVITGDETESISQYVRSAFDAAAGLLTRSASIVAPASPASSSHSGAPPSAATTATTAAGPAATGGTATAVPSEVLATLPPFCFPRGGRIYRERPEEACCSIFSYAIAHSGYFVTCLNYYQPADAKAFLLAWESVHPRAAGSKPAQDDSKEGTYVYLPAALCLLTRQPYLDLLHEAAALLLPLVASPVCPFSTLVDAVKVLHWVPQPISGALRLRIPFLGHTLTCASAPAGDMPLIDTAIHPFVMYFGSETIFKIVFSLILERRVLVFSSNLAALTPFMQVLLGLMHPFRWQHLYVPVVPQSMHESVEVPWPLLAGMDTKVKRSVLAELRKGDVTMPVVVDMDTAQVKFPEDMPEVPRHVKDKFVLQTTALVQPYELQHYGSYNFLSMDEHDRAQFLHRTDARIRDHLLGAMVNLFGKVRECIEFGLDPPVFDLEKFLRLHPDTTHDFFKAVASTSSFMVFKKSRLKLERDAFDTYAARSDSEFSVAEPVYIDVPDFMQSVAEDTAASKDSNGAFPAVPEQEVLHSVSQQPSQPASTISSRRSSGEAKSQRSSLRVLPNPKGSSSPPSTAAKPHGSHGAHVAGARQAASARSKARARAPNNHSHASNAGAVNSPSLRKTPITQQPAIDEAELPAPGADVGKAKSAEVTNDKVYSPTSSRNASTRRRRTSSCPEDYHRETVVDRYLRAFKTQLDISLLHQSEADVQSQLYYLRAVVAIAHFDIAQGISDFDAIAKATPSHFPRHRVLDMLLSLSDTDFEAVTKQKHSKLWIKLLEEAKLRRQRLLSFGVTEEDMSDPATPSTDRGNKLMLPEVGTYDEVLASLSDKEFLELDQFVSLTRFLRVCRSDNARSLFQALVAISGVESETRVNAAVFRAFLEHYRGFLEERRQDLPTNLSLAKSEFAILAQPLVRVKDVGTGLLTLTHHRLLFMKSRTSWVELCRLDDIVEVVTKEAKGVLSAPAPVLVIRYVETILSGQPQQKKPPKRPTSQAMQELILTFLTNRDNWYHYIIELQAGNKLARSTGDTTSISRAAQHIALAESVCKLYSQMRPGTAAITAAAPIEAVPAIRGLLALSHDQRPTHTSSLQSRNAFVTRVDACPDAPTKPSCECLLNRLDSADLLWCGLSNGQVRVYRLPTLDAVTSLKLHTDAVSSLCSVDSTVWTAGAVDGRVVVVTGDTFHVAEEIVVGGSLSVRQLIRVESTVLGITAQGVALRWSASRRHEVSRIDVANILGKTSLSMTKVAYVSGVKTTWIATEAGLAVLGGKRPELPKKTAGKSPRGSEKEEGAGGLHADADPSLILSLRHETFWGPLDVVESQASHGVVEGIHNEVWCYSGTAGLIEVRDGLKMETAKIGGHFRLDCDGFSDMCRTTECMWAAANNGSVYVFDLQLHMNLKELSIHRGPVRSICALRTSDERETVATGGAQQDGQIVIWRHNASVTTV